MIKACIFDMDGTLANTIDTIAYYANTALKEYGLKEIKTENYKYHVGSGYIQLIKNMFAEFNPWIFTDGSLFLYGLDAADMFILIMALLILLFVSIAKYKKIELRKWIFAQGIWFRYLMYLGALFVVLIFGIYGSNYDASQFIYFQF